MELYTEKYIYQVTLSDSDLERINANMPDTPFLDPVYDWCEHQFGIQTPDGRWYNIYNGILDIETYCFRNQEDRTFFVLKWSA